MVVIRQNQRKVVSLDQTAAMPIDIHDIVDGFFGSLHVHSPNTRFYTINCQFVNCFLLQTNSFLLFLQHQCHGTGFRTKLHHLFAIIPSTARLVWTGTNIVKCHLSTARALAAALTNRLSLVVGFVVRIFTLCSFHTLEVPIVICLSFFLLHFHVIRKRIACLGIGRHFAMTDTPKNTSLLK